MSGKKDPTVDPELKEKAQGLRKQAKKLIEDLKANYFYAPVDEWIRDMQEAQTAMKMLVLLVQAFAEAFSEKKRQRNLLDFSDMEQFALRILTEEKEGKLVPSAVAQEYQERFEEVMIDEYQDSNLVQETILTSVSRESAGQNNLFMVGDVKQSITDSACRARNSLWENITATVRGRAAGRELILIGTSEAEEKYLTVQIIFSGN